MTMGPCGAFIVLCRKHHVCKAAADDCILFACQRRQLQPRFVCHVNQQCKTVKGSPHESVDHCSHPTFRWITAREWEADLVKGFHRDRSRYKKSKPWQKKRKWCGEVNEGKRTRRGCFFVRPVALHVLKGGICSSQRPRPAPDVRMVLKSFCDATVEA